MKPALGSNIDFHSSADTTVGIAHGIRIHTRSRPRPRTDRGTISATPSPPTMSNTTVTTVKASVRSSAATHCDERKTAEKFDQPTKLCGRFPKDRLSKWNDCHAL